MKKRVKVGPYKTVFKGITFEVKQAKALYPSGKVKTFEMASRPPSVAILALDDKGRLLLIKEYRLKHKRYLLKLPAGKVDTGEKPIKAAQRELQEETGYKAGRLKLFHLTGASQTLDWKRYAYLATSLTKAPLKGDEDEDITVVPTTISQAYKLVKEGKIENEVMAYLIFKLYKQSR